MSQYLKIAFGYKTHRHMQVYWNNFPVKSFSHKISIQFVFKTMTVPANGGDIAQWLMSLIVFPEDGSTQHHLKVAHNHLYPQF